ncbi:hypothetical protein [Xanthomonas phage DES1]|nr:hypothetical protein [Xanthomonas phage DES1]
MSQVFVISDTHFFHNNVIKFEAEARPFSCVEDMNEALVDNWNKAVTKRDIVWHLGDVVFGGKHNLEILSRLNGIKKLVMGNHDHHGVREYLKYFKDVGACVQYDRCILTHVPIHESQFYRFKANVHGHLHSDKLEDPRYINVSCEQINLTPIAWEKIREIVRPT